MKPLIAATFMALACACCRERSTTVSTEADKPQTAPAERPASVTITGPHVLVYRTRTPLNNNVPVILTDDHSGIRSYPDPADLRGQPTPLPTELHQSYLLDNRGINKHVVFLNMTYPAYAALPNAPSQAELFTMIKDKDPLTELCDCGPRSGFSDLVGQLNTWIDEGSLRTHCTVVK